MSRTEDRYREKDAGKKGYNAGLFREPRESNPYKLGTATRLAWDREWEHGMADARRARLDCSSCDQISLQRITTRSESDRDIALVGIGKGKKPYEVRCKKCGRQWKTNADYAQEMGSVGGMRRRVCKVCGIPREAQSFGKVNGDECCSFCMPKMIEKNTAGIRAFTKKFLAGRS